MGKSKGSERKEGSKDLVQGPRSVDDIAYDRFVRVGHIRELGLFLHFESCTSGALA